MKLPRWLLIGMWTSSVLAVLAAAGWCWVTWPERTARCFCILMADLQFEEATTICSPPAIDFLVELEENMKVKEMKIDEAEVGQLEEAEQLKGKLEEELDELRACFKSPSLQPRTWLDLLLGCMEFDVADSNLRFSVRRGKVVECEAVYLLKER